MVSTSGGGGGGGICPRECESCRSAPGVPFCRVEWSFLCTGCASLAHANSWIVVVPPTPNPNPNPSPSPTTTPFAYPYPSANPNPHPAAAAAVVQLSSDDDDDEAAAGERRRRRRRRPAAVPAEAPGPYERVASVMRYREKRKSRRFDKNVRYEVRQAYAELRPRVDGKFARPEGPEAAGDEATAAAAAEEEEKSNGSEQLGPEACDVVAAPISGGELDPPLPEEVELEAMGSREV